MSGLTDLWGPDLAGFERVDGGVTAAAGFRAGGVVSGVKVSGKPDLALVVADGPCGVVTGDDDQPGQGAVLHAVGASRGDGRAQAVVINAGNANVCVPDGEAHTERMAAATASATGLAPSDVPRR